MACPALTNKGGTLWISENPQTEDLTIAQLDALTYKQVPGVGSIDDTGMDQSIETYATFGATPWAVFKGAPTGMAWGAEIKDSASPGQEILELSSRHDNHNAYALKVEWSNGDIEAGINKVHSPVASKGAGSGVRLLRYSFAPVYAMKTLKSS